MPLAARLRPVHLRDYVGQQHLLGEGKSLRQAIEQDRLFSMVLWGPPGTGKTTLARLVAEYTRAHFTTLSAVLAGVKDIRAAVDAAKIRLAQGQRTILFVDEVHRFNKAQQDAFLPFVEEGTVTFIGATTENPSFELNNALLSRARVFVLKSLTEADLLAILERAVQVSAESLGKPLTFPEPLRQMLVGAADGDARRLLNLTELCVDLADANQDGERDTVEITEAVLEESLTQSLRRFDKGGEYFYDQISALHKSVRGSDPDAALYWYCRMLDGGCDPLYIARRVVRMASEDIGNAEPRALTLALNAWDTHERLGSPEGELTLAQAIVFLACAPKSNAVYKAYNAAMADVRQEPGYEVPLHLRNAPTDLMKSLDYGAGYRYDHDEPGAYAAGQDYFPAQKQGTRYYAPVDRGLEKKIADKLAHLRSLDQQNRSDKA